MTENDKFAAYLDETLQIDVNDPTQGQRILDMRGAWMMRASEPPALASGWRQTAVEVMQRLDVDIADTPSAATTVIGGALDAMSAAIRQANEQIQGLAYRDEIIKNQQNILDSCAMLLRLPSGKFYMDMVPMLQALTGLPPESTGEENGANSAQPQLVGPDNTPTQ